MLKFNNKEPDLMKALNISSEEIEKIHEWMDRITANRDNNIMSVTWTLQRIWIDETLSDNCKCFLIFTLGRFYELTNFMGGGE